MNKYSAKMAKNKPALAQFLTVKALKNVGM